MVNINNLLKQVTKENPQDRMNNIYLPFNSMVKASNRPKWQAKDWTKVSYKDAIALFQANHYCNVYSHLGITDDKFKSPFDVIAECERRGIIHGRFMFPEKINRKKTSGMGAMWEFSDQQLEHIRHDQGYRWNADNQIERPMHMDGLSGGIRSGKTASNLFKLSMKAVTPMLNGDRMAIFGANFSAINRIATSETGNGSILEILPHAQLVKTDSESQKIVVPSLVFPFEQTTEIWLIGLSSKRSMGNVLGITLDVCYFIELSQILNYEEIALEALNRSIASRFRYVVWDTNPFINPAINRFVALFSGEPIIEKSQAFYRYTHWTILTGSNPSLPPGSDRFNDVIETYSIDQYAFRSKIKGEWLKPTGTVLTRFTREHNVIADIKQLGNIRPDHLWIGIDEGGKDASVVSAWLTYWSFDRMRVEAVLLAEAYHKTGIKSTIPNVDTSPIAPSQFAKIILDFGQLAYRKVKAIAGHDRFAFELYIDPSALNLSREIESLAVHSNLAYPDIYTRSSPRKADNGTKLTQKIGQDESREQQFRQLNQCFDTGVFHILESDMFGFLPDGSFAYSTEQNIHENETFVRIKGKIPYTGEGHMDSIVVNRYFSNYFMNEYQHHQLWGDIEVEPLPSFPSPRDQFESQYGVKY